MSTVFQEVVNILIRVQIYSVIVLLLFCNIQEFSGYYNLKLSQVSCICNLYLFSWISPCSHMVLIFFWMLAEAAQATKNLHLHIILKGFSLLFVTALLH